MSQVQFPKSNIGVGLWLSSCREVNRTRGWASHDHDLDLKGFLEHYGASGTNKKFKIGFCSGPPY